MIKVNIEQHSEAWHQIKLGRFTGSRFAKLMAGETTDTYKDLLVEVAGEILTGESEETYINADMERGSELEPEARQQYENIFGEVEQCGFILLDENNPIQEYVGYSPDGLIKDGLIEIKCPKLKTHINYIRANILPNTYKWQVQGGLMITGAKWCDFISYYPNLKPFIIRVYPDLEMHKQLTERIKISIIRLNEILKTYKEYSYE